MVFLERNKYLQYLSLCGCFSVYQNKITALLVKYLKTKPMIQSLIVKGSLKNFLGKLAYTVVKAAVQCPLLVNLDISNNKIEDKCIEQLAEIYNNPSIKLRTFDFNNTAAKYFSSFKETLRVATLHKTLRTNFPYDDLKFKLSLDVMENHHSAL